jgi:hypothetical protein
MSLYLLFNLVALLRFTSERAIRSRRKIWWFSYMTLPIGYGYHNLRPKVRISRITNVDASKASLAQKQGDLKKLQIAAESNAATELEVEHAKMDMKIAALSLEPAFGKCQK